MRAAVVIVVVLASVIAPRIAAADGGRDDEARAKRVYLQAEQDYAAGRYERAVAGYKEAYDLSDKPQLLFNIGNAYERLNRYHDAAVYLRRYLELAEVENRRAVEQRIKRLEQKDDEQKAMLAKLAAAKAAEAELEKERAEGREPGGEVREGPSGDTAPAVTDRYKWWLGGGAVALVAAGVFGLASYSAGNQAEHQCAMGLCPASAGGDLTRERVFAVAADASAVLGLAAVGYGSYLLWKQRDASVAIAPVLSADGVGVSIAGAL